LLLKTEVHGQKHVVTTAHPQLPAGCASTPPGSHDHVISSFGGARNNDFWIGRVNPIPPGERLSV
jgi:hypothetical protein